MMPRVVSVPGMLYPAINGTTDSGRMSPFSAALWIACAKPPGVTLSLVATVANHSNIFSSPGTDSCIRLLSSGPLTLKICSAQPSSFSLPLPSGGNPTTSTTKLGTTR